MWRQCMYNILHLMLAAAGVSRIPLLASNRATSGGTFRAHPGARVLSHLETAMFTSEPALIPALECSLISRRRCPLPSPYSNAEDVAVDGSGSEDVAVDGSGSAETTTKGSGGTPGPAAVPEESRVPSSCGPRSAASHGHFPCGSRLPTMSRKCT